MKNQFGQKIFFSDNGKNLRKRFSYTKYGCFVYVYFLLSMYYKNFEILRQNLEFFFFF